MRRTTLRSHRGSCLLALLVGFAVLGLLLAIAGVVAMLTSGASEAVATLETQVKTFAENAEAFEAPGSKDVEMAEGGGLVLVTPDGKVGDKVIGMPSRTTDFTITVTDPDGGPVKFDAVARQSSAGQPLQVVGVFETTKAGTYKVDAATSDGSKVALSVVAGTKEDVEAVLRTVGAMAQGFFGFCGTVCGAGLLLAFGIPALIVRMRARKASIEPHAHA